jgi:hypothetical protein
LSAIQQQSARPCRRAVGQSAHAPGLVDWYRRQPAPRPAPPAPPAPHQHHTSTRQASCHLFPHRLLLGLFSAGRPGPPICFASPPAPLAVLGACDDQRLASVLGLAPLSLTFNLPYRPSPNPPFTLSLYTCTCTCTCTHTRNPAFAVHGQPSLSPPPLLHSHTSLSPPPPLIARCPLPFDLAPVIATTSLPSPLVANTHHPADPLPRLRLYLAASLACPDRFLTPSAPPSRYCPPHSCRRFRSTRLACRIRPSRSRRPTHLHQSLADPRYFCSAPTPPWTVRSHCHPTCLLPLSSQPQPLQWPPAQPKTLPPAPTTATAMAAVPLARLCCSL